MTKPKTTKPASPWRSANDELPDVGVEVLAINSGGLHINEIQRSTKYTGELEWLVGGVRYWMPMPPLPEEQEAK